MAVSAHLRELKLKHTHLDEKIRHEMKSLHPDTLRISMLKKEKLRLKEEIGRFLSVKTG